MLEVLEPGAFTTIQDAGRRDHGHLGVARAGAADPLAYAVANVLVGNPETAAAIEMTLLGPTLAVRADCLVAIAGADMGAVIGEDGSRLAPGQSRHLRRGATLVFGPAVDGARAYLALRGGVRADVVLGSASTDPVAGFGGLGSGPLETGSLIEPASHTVHPDEPRSWPYGVPGSGIAFVPGPRELALLPGPHLERMAHGTAAEIAGSVWTVTPRSDRVGVRLVGEPVRDAGRLGLVSLPMVPGALQVPPGGQPIVLMQDAPSVGGYPVPGVVVVVDRPALGQLRAGDEVRFTWTDAATARGWARDVRARFDAVSASF